MTYYVVVHDAVIGQDIQSATAVLNFDVRPLPTATGFQANWVVRENDVSPPITLAEGPLTGAVTGYDYDRPEFLKEVLIDSLPDSGKLSMSAFDCSGPVHDCDATVTLVTDQYGSTSFDYRLVVTDGGGLGDLTSPAAATINMDIRPIIRAHDNNSSTNLTLLGIENENVSWTLSNNVNQGFTYPTDAAYTSVLGTLAITPMNEANGTVTTSSCTGAANGSSQS